MIPSSFALDAFEIEKKGTYLIHILNKFIFSFSLNKEPFVLFSLSKQFQIKKTDRVQRLLAFNI